VHGHGLIGTGDRVRWDDTFCRQMTLGAAHVVPDSTLDASYAVLPDSPAVRAYVGYPIRDDHGNLFGILCGVADSPLPDPAAVDDDLVETLSHLLSSHLAAARAADRDRRAARVATALADTDALTGLMNRRGWDSLIADAQERVDAFGDPVAVAVLDLDGLKQVNDTAGHEAGDDLLRRAGEALRLAATDRDRVARYGGDEFVVLSNNVPVTELAAHYARFVHALRQHGIEASLGHAFTGPGERTVREAFRQADAAMYDVKRARRAG
jgi:diguanylate cyclase (GGDEF)-like protein